jgi:ubiquinone biosynthesis protein
LLFKNGITHLQHMNRYKEVANIFIKHGFGFLFDRMSLNNITGFFKSRVREQENDVFTRPQRLRMALEELGPTYIKIGQLLSIRPDLLGSSYIEELEKLQDHVPPISNEELIHVLRQKNLDPERDFKSFDPLPIAAASIAQVHSAYLHNGQRVVVKIQRPEIKEKIHTDLEILTDLSKLLEKRTDWGRFYHISEIIAELGQAIRSELDFLNEGRNAEIFADNFRHESNVIIPRVFWDYSSDNILVLEYIAGIKIIDFANLKKSNMNNELIAERLLKALFLQIFIHGFFHADPHPGNIAISAEQKIVFYDFGQVGTIDHVLKDKCVDLIISMMRYDVSGVTDSLLAIAIGGQSVNRNDLVRDVAKLEQKYYGVPMSQIKLGESLGELLELSSRYQVRIPPELSLMAKMLMTVESIIVQLDPQISIVDIAGPYGRKLMMQRYSLRQMSRKSFDLAWDYVRLMQKMPHHTENLMRVLNEGEFTVKMEHVNLKSIASKVDVLSNRLSVAIILAAILIGSALIMDNNPASILNRLPLADIGFSIAAILGFSLTYSIIKSGRY